MRQRDDFELSPEFLARAHKTFRQCWAEAESHASHLDSERQSSLRRTIASRVLREARQCSIDDLEFIRRVLRDIGS